MKVVVITETNEAAYVTSDDVSIDLQSNQILVGALPVLDLNENNCTVQVSDTVPSDYVSGNYLYHVDAAEGQSPWEKKADDWQAPKPDDWVDPTAE